MNTYTVEHKYAKQLVEATDTDMAVMKAVQLHGENGVSAEDFGPLYSITLHHPKGDQTWFTAEEVPAEAPKPKLPPRRARGMTLSYDSGDLFVNRLGYSGSLMMVANEGELHSPKSWTPMELSDADMKIVDEWMENFDAYFEANGWATWAEINEA